MEDKKRIWISKTNGVDTYGLVLDPGDEDGDVLREINDKGEGQGVYIYHSDKMALIHALAITYIDPKENKNSNDENLKRNSPQAKKTEFNECKNRI